MKETQLLPVHAANLWANLWANCGNTAYGVENIVGGDVNAFNRVHPNNYEHGSCFVFFGAVW